ncbi:MAG: hypothetical protein JRN62_03800 [Nitrososphaerota archaeon]|jgi:hypothetical protein|nr:hypothetical protein [Nitrososphaerota archaeon]MDG6948726.1 hypothetical protein [Nitrososphaerota archaeon]
MAQATLLTNAVTEVMDPSLAPTTPEDVVSEFRRASWLMMEQETQGED